MNRPKAPDSIEPSAEGPRFEALLGLLYEEDPINLTGGDSNRDEYSPEAERILLSLSGCTCISDVVDLVHRTFVSMFDLQLAGSPERYVRIATRIWDEMLT